MSLLWVLVVAVPVAAALAYGRQRMRRRARYVETPAWTQEHWQEEHERDKAALRRSLEGP
jgi:hypothetical protein